MLLSPLVPVEPSTALRLHPPKTFARSRTFFVYRCLRTLHMRVYSAYVSCRINDTQHYFPPSSHQNKPTYLGHTWILSHNFSVSTRTYRNLGVHSTQQNEGYHVITKHNLSTSLSPLKAVRVIVEEVKLNKGCHRRELTMDAMLNLHS